MVERLARWMWGRWRARWVWVLTLSAVVVFDFVLLPIALATYALIFELTLAKSLAIYAVLVPLAVLLATFIIHGVGRTQVAVLNRWLRGDHSDPALVHQTSITVIRFVIRRTVLFVLPPFAVVCCALITLAIGRSWAAGFALFAGVCGLAFALGVVLVIGFDLLMRPLREEVDADLGVFEPVVGNSVRSKLLLSTMTMGWLVGMITPVIAVRQDSPEARFGWSAVAAWAVGFGFLIINRLFVLDPIIRPLEDLHEGTTRVAAGQFDQRLPLTSDDEFGIVIGSFNKMQAGLLERERLHAAFGSYVDPALAQRLLAQGDDLFAGEEVDVTVFFADVRDFTPFAERATPQEAVERLNRLFSLVVPILRDHHGHANKFLGDGVLAVFGVPEQIDDHADQALAAALEIQRRVGAEFGGALRLGIGINTGRVIAGTIGGGGKLEFTLIGDAVNVAARVEERTKTTLDPILLTQSTLDALTARPGGLVERGDHDLRGKSATTCLYAVPIS